MHSKNIVILTSRENFVWTSMQEIIPLIEQSWDFLCQKENFHIHSINVDNDSISKNLKYLLSADVFVVTCFNVKIASAIILLRTKLQLDTKIIFYLHGLATIALWPLKRFGVLDVLSSSDIFIGTCEGDLASVKLSLENAQCVKIPFTITEYNIQKLISQTIKPFVFIGRISPQKNLDQLILAYAQLSSEIKANHLLIIYGAEDHLGYPNLGIKDANYLLKLQEIIKEHNLNSHVILKGFVDRHQIQEELKDGYIFVSPSTHSDENFGMAAFRALIHGSPAILSRWGGHIEYQQEFREQVTYVSPYLNNKSEINTTELYHALLEASKKTSDYDNRIPHHFSMESISQSLLSLLEKEGHSAPLIPTSIAKNVFLNQERFEKEGEIQRCFTSFNDPNFIDFFKAYSVI